MVSMDPTLFSRILNGRRRPPADFAATVSAALDRLERADRAREAYLTGPPEAA